MVSFGGPERPEEVRPFLESVLGARAKMTDRIDALVQRYQRFGGISPINEQTRALLAALLAELNAHGPRWPVYWATRHGHPRLSDTLRQMAEDGIGRALGFVPSAFGSYPSCRQYLEAIEQASRQVGSQAPQIDKLRLFYNHPGFIEALADRVHDAFSAVPEQRRPEARLVFAAHSLPRAMADRCEYEKQLAETSRLVAQTLGWSGWDLVYHSRTGRPEEPWLVPDLCDHLRQLRLRSPIRDVVLVPLSYVCENLEILYDLDVAASAVCEEVGIEMVRAEVVGTHPRFVRMIRELIEERIDARTPRQALGTLGPSPDDCPPGCCEPRRA